MICGCWRNKWNKGQLTNLIDKYQDNWGLTKKACRWKSLCVETSDNFSISESQPHKETWHHNWEKSLQLSSCLYVEYWKPLVIISGRRPAYCYCTETGHFSATFPRKYALIKKKRTSIIEIFFHLLCSQSKYFWSENLTKHRATYMFLVIFYITQKVSGSIWKLRRKVTGGRKIYDENLDSGISITF